MKNLRLSEAGTNEWGYARSIALRLMSSGYISSSWGDGYRSPGTAPYLTLSIFSADPNETDYNYYKNLLISYGVPEENIRKGHEPKVHYGDPNKTGWSIQFSVVDNIDDVINIVNGFINDNRYNIVDNDDAKKELKNLPEELVRLSRTSTGTSSSYQRSSSNRIEEISQQILANENQPLHNIFSNAVQRYNNSRQNRFTFFGLIQRSSTQRNTAVDQLRSAYDSYKADYWSKSRDESKRDFLAAVIDIRNRVQADHLRGSRFATAGLTKSGLVQEIDHALTQCVEQGIFTQEEVGNLQQTAIDHSPTRIATF
ncbi:hypothetical protein [Legionella sp. CNM-4043-24]|uniref:hypothetical protein n=1 Tax=Legionella sp. CNM-4043-24 TaxID=3421646 RepID=UPI00403A9E11